MPVATAKSMLEEAVRRSRARVQGWEKIQQAQHAALLSVALQAFGDDPRARFYAEDGGPSGHIPRPDLIIVHPEIGVLVIENKGVWLQDIHAVRSTTLTLVRDGRLKEEDPFLQSERVIFRLKDLAARHIGPNEMLRLNTVALPKISRAVFESKFQVSWPDHALFQEDVADARSFRDRVLRFASTTQAKAGRGVRLNKRACDVVQAILDGRSFLYPSRKTQLDTVDPQCLGVQVQELELGLKQLTAQQQDVMKSDHRGAHRLFRGVAGSGKTVMLAHSVARTLAQSQEEQASKLFEQAKQSSRVLVVCFNKTLVHFLREKIDDCYGRMTWAKPTNDELTVVHFEGLVRQLITQEPRLQTELTFREKVERALDLIKRFDEIPAAEREPLMFDAIYVDESQDLSPEEIQFLLKLARRDDQGRQTFNVFYDNAQNIYGVTPPVWQQIGVEIVGRTTFLDQCLRNTRETLSLAFNVLVGSFAPEGERVTTRQFADAGSLRSRKLIEENGDRYDIHFAARTGPKPIVEQFADRRAEIRGVVEKIKQLTGNPRVLPSDILVLYKSHYSFELLEQQLVDLFGRKGGVRLVNPKNDRNKNVALLQEGILTVSTIASAKGYDAPIVFVVGADEITTDTQGRAGFYVATTRAKLLLWVSGIKRTERSLLDEVLETHQALFAPAKVASAAVAAVDAAITAKCKHCGSKLLHAQHGRYGYFYKCIECAGNTSMKWTCNKCGKQARIRKDGMAFFAECCGDSELIHRNVPLDSLEE